MKIIFEALEDEKMSVDVDNGGELYSRNSVLSLLLNGTVTLLKHFEHDDKSKKAFIKVLEEELKNA